MFDFFARQKGVIVEELKKQMEAQISEKTVSKEFEEKTLRRLYEYSVTGKMIRGGLTAFSYSLFRNSIPLVVSQVGGALELFQSAFLIHDDIMDNDLYRRGKPAMHYQYQLAGKEENFSESGHYGEALGICVGDIAFFSAFNIISSLKMPCHIHREMMRLFVRELTQVGIAQMREIYLSKICKEVNEEDIYNVYLFKTGRYTFSLPLMLGAILADQNAGVLEFFSELGEYMGLIFQIKDDEIGLYGDSREIGKPTASDIKESKKTLYYCKLFRKASAEEKEKLSGIFGNHNIGISEINYTLDLMEKLGVRADVQALMEKFQNRINEMLLGCDFIDSPSKDMFFSLIEYNMKRRK